MLGPFGSSGCLLHGASPMVPQSVGIYNKAMEIFPVGGGKQPHFIDVVFSWFPGFGQVGLVGPVQKADIWY